jgi:hypothetical protein
VTQRTHYLWVQELLSSRGLDTLVDDSAIALGQLTFSANGKSIMVPVTDLLTRTVSALADTIQAALG